MEIREFADMDKFEDIMNNWAKATGLATVAVGADGKYISGCYNFTDFCIKLTRGSKEGCRRCEKCDREDRFSRSILMRRSSVRWRGSLESMRIGT